MHASLAHRAFHHYDCRDRFTAVQATQTEPKGLGPGSLLQAVGKETACFSGAALLVEQNPGAAFGSCISSCDCERKQRKAGGTH